MFTGFQNHHPWLPLFNSRIIIIKKPARQNKLHYWFLALPIPPSLIFVESKVKLCRDARVDLTQNSSIKVSITENVLTNYHVLENKRCSQRLHLTPSWTDVRETTKKWQGFVGFPVFPVQPQARLFQGMGKVPFHADHTRWQRGTVQAAAPGDLYRCLRSR